MTTSSGIGHPGTEAMPHPRDPFEPFPRRTDSEDEHYAASAQLGQGPAKEMTDSEKIRIQKLRTQRGHPGREVLPPDPRDPDIVRAKALARTPRRPVRS